MNCNLSLVIIKFLFSVFPWAECWEPGERGAECRTGHQTGEGQSGEAQSEEDEPGGDAALPVRPQGGPAFSANQVWCCQEADQEEEGNDAGVVCGHADVKTSAVQDGHKLFGCQSDLDATVKLEFDDDGDGGTGENSVAKPKAPRVKKEKKEPGQY